MPAALGLGTPWVDLTKTGDTVAALEEVDQVLLHYDGTLGAAARLYADGRTLTEPGLSPYYGDWTGFPPTILVAGTRDMLLSSTVLVHRKLRAAGIRAELHVFEGMSHGFYLAVPAAPNRRKHSAKSRRSSIPAGAAKRAVVRSENHLAAGLPKVIMRTQFPASRLAPCPRLCLPRSFL